jgi:hypothetical protein
MTCFGAVEYVRRRWIILVGHGATSGRWMHLAYVEGGFVHISKAKFERLVSEGVTRRADCNRHPGIGPKAPTKTVRA